MANIRELVRELSGRNNFTDISMYEAIVNSVDFDNHTINASALNGSSVEFSAARLMTTKNGDGVIFYPSIDSTVIILSTPTINPIVVGFGETQRSRYTSSDNVTIVAQKVELQSDEYGGIVKIEPLLEKINKLEDVVNNLINLFNTHTHIASSFGTPTTTPPSLDTDIIVKTIKEDLENPDATHGAKPEQ